MVTRATVASSSGGGVVNATISKTGASRFAVNALISRSATCHPLNLALPSITSPGLVLRERCLDKRPMRNASDIYTTSMQTPHVGGAYSRIRPRSRKPAAA